MFFCMLRILEFVRNEKILTCFRLADKSLILHERNYPNINDYKRLKWIWLIAPISPK